MESNGVLGTLWVSLALGAFYTALTWINILLGIFLTPLFAMAATWFTDKGTLRTQSFK